MIRWVDNICFFFSLNHLLKLIEGLRCYFVFFRRQMKLLMKRSNLLFIYLGRCKVCTRQTKIKKIFDGTSPEVELVNCSRTKQNILFSLSNYKVFQRENVFSHFLKGFPREPLCTCLHNQDYRDHITQIGSDVAC